MLLAVVLCVLGLVLVLVAVYRDEDVAAPGPALPEWEPIPTPAEVGRADFPLAFPGYDPASVEVHLDVLRRAYTDLYEATPPEIRERARTILRAGGDPREAGVRSPADEDPVEDQRRQAVTAEHALSLEAQLAPVDADGDDQPHPDRASVAGGERT